MIALARSIPSAGTQLAANPSRCKRRVAVAPAAETFVLESMDVHLIHKA